MLGVVVWSDAKAAGAVIWCEDHAQLAYLRGAENLRGSSWPQVGDLVQFRLASGSGVRFARALAVLSGALMPQLPRALLAAAQAFAAPEATAPRLRRVG